MDDGVSQHFDVERLQVDFDHSHVGCRRKTQLDAHAAVFVGPVTHRVLVVVDRLQARLAVRLLVLCAPVGAAGDRCDW